MKHSRLILAGVWNEDANKWYQVDDQEPPYDGVLVIPAIKERMRIKIQTTGQIVTVTHISEPDADGTVHLTVATESVQR